MYPHLVFFSLTSYYDGFCADLNNLASIVEVSPVATKWINTVHPQSLIIGEPNSSVQTRSQVHKKTTSETAILSVILRLLKDPSWVDAIQEEMQQFKFKMYGILVDLPEGCKKKGKSYCYFSIFLLLGFMVYQMDVKSEFFNEALNESKCDSTSRDYGSSISQEGLPVVRRSIWTSSKDLSSLIQIRFTNVLDTSRPDIMFVVSACSRNQVNLLLHLEVSEEDFQYLKGQPNWEIHNWWMSVSGREVDAHAMQRNNNYAYLLPLKQMLKIHTDDNVADLLTKAFDGPRFTHLVVNIRMLNP
ncbi:hypothetical protein Tco_0078563 [Tanacetum coccineum]